MASVSCSHAAEYRAKLAAFKTTQKLNDLGDLDKELAGIFSPLYDPKLVESYIHKQFLEEAANYVARYQNVEHWKHLLQSAQPHFARESSQPARILDIGSGAGNTVFALFELYPQATLIASDLSVPLLRALKEHQQKHYRERSCLIMQLNAEELIFEPDQFDLVVGGSILHHLFNPERTVAQCYKVLKPGGAAVFFEPFELGNQILALVFKQLIRANHYHSREAIHPRIVGFFRALCIDYEFRTGTNKGREEFAHMDDKWLFTRSYFEKMAESVGFREATIYSLHDAADLFFNQIKSLLRIGVHADEAVLPQWAVDQIREVDEQFSPEQREELLIEAGVVFKKRG